MSEPVVTFESNSSDCNIRSNSARPLLGTIDVFKQKLQRELGEDVLQEVKVVIAHPVDRCLFQDTYKFSFVRS